jgi:hypothetical protein
MTRTTVAANELYTLPTPFTVTHINGTTVMPIEVEHTALLMGQVLLHRTETEPGPPVQLGSRHKVTVRY